MTDEQLAASWADSSGDVAHVIVDESTVDPFVVEAAKTGRGFAAAHLGIPIPLMRFYVAERPDHKAYRSRYGCVEWPSFKAAKRNGHADRSTGSIGLRADLGLKRAVEVAAHEVLHLTQPGVDSEAEEALAIEYGRWTADLLVRRGKLAAVHVCDGHPYKVDHADSDDVALDVTDGCVRTNFGSRANPRWVPHYVSSPVTPSVGTN